MKSDALNKLNSIDWSRLQAAGGTAEEVPHLVRALVEIPLDRAEDFETEQLTSVFHKLLVAHDVVESDEEPDRKTLSRVFDSTARAVEVFFDLLVDPNVVGRWDLLSVTSFALTGRTAALFPFGLDLAKRVEGLSSDEARHVIDVYQVVNEHIDRIYHLLEEEDPELRMVAIELLAWLPDHASQSIGRLAQLLESPLGQEPGPLASTLLALGTLSCYRTGDSFTPLIQRFLEALDHESPSVQVAACGGLILICESARIPIPTAVLKFVANSLPFGSVADEDDLGVVFNDGYLGDYLVRLPPLLSCDRRFEFIRYLESQLGAGDWKQDHNIAFFLISLVDTEDRGRGVMPPPGTFTEDERRVFAVIAGVRTFWEEGDPDMIRRWLYDSGLPTSPEGLRSIARNEAVAPPPEP